MQTTIVRLYISSYHNYNLRRRQKYNNLWYWHFSLKNKLYWKTLLENKSTSFLWITAALWRGISCNPILVSVKWEKYIFLGVHNLVAFVRRGYKIIKNYTKQQKSHRLRIFHNSWNWTTCHTKRNECCNQDANIKLYPLQNASKEASIETGKVINRYWICDAYFH